jgi:tRNA wybutosine-synthesizing protein 4
MNDVWIFDKQWTQVESLQIGIYRHCAVQVGDDKVVVFGGRTTSGVSGDWFLYTYEEGLRKLICDDSPNLWGASLAWSHGRGILVGGINDEGDCVGDAYTWTIDETSLKIALQRWRLSVSTHSLTQRFGAKVVPWDDDFLVIGGAGSHRILSWSEQFVLISPSNESIQIMDVRRSAAPEPWLIGYDVAVQENSGNLTLVGGGGVCFSFGSFWNEKIFQLTRTGIHNSIQRWKLLEETSSQTPTERARSFTKNQSQQIPRIQITTPQHWRQILQSSEVCVLEGLNFGSCTTKWTPEYLKSIVGDKKVIIHSTDAGAMNFLSKNFEYRPCSFNDFIDSVFSTTTTEKVYLRAVSDDVKNKPTRLEEDFPGLAGDFEVPTILCGVGGIEKERIFSTVLRVGSVGTSMWLHYDV